jgi:hypothetical protein
MGLRERLGLRLKQVGGAKHYKKWNLWSVGDEVYGKYLCCTPNKKFRNNVNYEFEVISVNFAEGNTDGEGKEIKAGSVLSLNGSGSLNYKMGEICEGSKVFLEYKGMSVLESGDFEGSDAHDIDVFEDEDGSNDGVEKKLLVTPKAPSIISKILNKPSLVKPKTTLVKPKEDEFDDL